MVIDLPVPSCWKNPTDVANTPDKRASWKFIYEQEAFGCHGMYDDDNCDDCHECSDVMRH